MIARRGQGAPFGCYQGRPTIHSGIAEANRNRTGSCLACAMLDLDQLVFELIDRVLRAA
jgi:hypothetical protein